MSTSRILQLAQQIVANTTVLDEHLSRAGLKGPSFEPGAPIDAFQPSNADVDRAKSDAIEATIELRQLLEGPIKLLMPEVMFPNRVTPR
jgi:hypothetical protein